ncbi:MAG: hypothetical protein WC538_19755 [Thermoanaerobaculia bacterium]|jgi:hypothetical protein
MTDRIEYTSPPLSSEELEKLWELFPQALRELLGDGIVLVSYGTLSKLHPDLWYVPMKVGTAWMDRFLRESIEQGISGPAEADIFFQLPEGGPEILFCHEGDVHISASAESSLLFLLGREPFARLFPGKEFKRKSVAPREA